MEPKLVNLHHDEKARPEISLHAIWRSHVALFFEACFTSSNDSQNQIFLCKLFRIDQFWNFSKSFQNEKIYEVRSSKFQRECFAPLIFWWRMHCGVRWWAHCNFESFMNALPHRRGDSCFRALAHWCIRAFHASLQESSAASISNESNHRCLPKLKFRKKLKFASWWKIGNHIF